MGEQLFIKVNRRKIYIIKIDSLENINKNLIKV